MQEGERERKVSCGFSLINASTLLCGFECILHCAYTQTHTLTQARTHTHSLSNSGEAHLSLIHHCTAESRVD